jgi:hypothetical protein
MGIKGNMTDVSITITMVMRIRIPLTLTAEVIQELKEEEHSNP